MICYHRYTKKEFLIYYALTKNLKFSKNRWDIAPNQQKGVVMNSVYLVSGKNVHLTQSGIFGK